MAANTNLERFRTGLSTLLIGATLVQIEDISAWVGGLGKDLVKTGTIANDALVPVIVILFFSLSFLGVYLITRLYLTAAFMQLQLDSPIGKITLNENRQATGTVFVNEVVDGPDGNLTSKMVARYSMPANECSWLCMTAA